MALPKHTGGGQQVLAQGPGTAELQEWFSALSSVTDRLRESHEKLHHRVNELEDELAQKNRALERKHRLEALGKIAAGVAHEIRNPLGSLTLYVDLIESFVEQEVVENDRGVGICQRMRKAVQHLSTTVNDTLTFTEPGRATIEPYDPVGVVEESLALATAQAAGVEVIRGFPEARRTAHGDPDWLRRILLNLLGNACQAMPEGGRLTVTVAYDRTIAVRIRDTGPGIPPENLERVFDPFWTQREGGTGLGLSIVHSLVERLEGHIELANRPEGGLEATLHLPWNVTDQGE